MAKRWSMHICSSRSSGGHALTHARVTELVTAVEKAVVRGALRWYHPAMRKADEKRIAATLAKVMAMMCVRNTKLEDIHAGLVPVTKTGDYSDVVVVDADGREIPWPEVSHIDDDQMRELMKEIVNRLYTFQMRIDDPEFQAWIDRWAAVAGKWDEPELQDFRSLRSQRIP
jgi:hypothetical protein